MTKSTKAILALEDGTVFEGLSFGADNTCEGEVCFNTSMTGYQEILTDPSYSGQIVAMTYPEIGNYGVNITDIESNAIQASGFIVKNCSEWPSNYRNGQGYDKENILTLSEYLRQNNIPGIKNIDTRKLVRILREKGALTGILATGTYNKEEIIQRAQKVPQMTGQDLATTVTTKEQYNWTEDEYDLCFKKLESMDVDSKKPLIVTIDFGVKLNIMRKLHSLGATLITVPSTTSAKDIMALKPDGVMLSNGPGDPEPIKYAQETIVELIGKVPIFGICLGHQLLSLALGAKTFKLKFGHRGANHPIKNLETGEVAITSQNHGFAVDPGSIDTSILKITHINLNDNTVAGIRHKTLPVFSVQYHPEASPGPRDSEYLFVQFMKNILEHKK
ncbi:MAG: glutamine-hydrolyzing carbamoyl-phosphate synthase small subunit [Fibrobacteria bacterium]|nr:glutamine-hydrolyzing carbamoyl-phosphate synthase small subunit [Fibrobacteria bacterium]